MGWQLKDDILGYHFTGWNTFTKQLHEVRTEAYSSHQHSSLREFKNNGFNWFHTLAIISSDTDRNNVAESVGRLHHFHSIGCLLLIAKAQKPCLQRVDYLLRQWWVYCREIWLPDHNLGTASKLRHLILEIGPSILACRCELRSHRVN